MQSEPTADDRHVWDEPRNRRDLIAREFWYASPPCTVTEDQCFDFADSLIEKMDAMTAN